MKSCTIHVLCCDEPTYRDVTDLLYTIKSEISLLGNQVLDSMWYGRAVGGDTDRRIQLLRIYHRFIERIRGALRYGGDLCLSCDHIQKVVESIRRIIRRKCEGNMALGLDKDTSRIVDWSVRNPFCIAYENWEKAMYAVSEKIKFDLRIVNKTKACKISYSLLKKDITCDIFVDISKKAKNCRIKYDIFADEKSCDIKYAGILTKKECKLKYKELLKSKDCKLAFHDYVNIVNCGVGADLIRSVYDCGLSVKFSVAEACPVLVTGEGDEFEFSSFTVQNETDLWGRLADLNIA